ncbi:TerD family protein [methanotrophic endosymbiont of Bathymodiolus puteoserpentis (Logatchev)]|jgi:tellurium resistance protein TerZ|uniref:TerD family protein n=1 Tax=methanotrophic endosymbiont of Bathymodiolus puteoserpentis (Logatchev) TaxID=343235 RepID=UPI0013C944C1|nr:TerD family protein [methanotrophic endosymbiont of Bathymodiolus puteoserpentis (Logatchev)]SHE23002.1 Tellurium resistance protein [methanotrophic endosymbiont of Bathymodiolus puteoserpentis (Logatchev)]
MAISLQKGQRISLEKSSGGALQKLCVGANWGAIEKKGLLGGKKMVAVDLDLSVALFDSNKTLLDLVYFGQLQAKKGGIKHSGDDTEGDVGGDDGLDNEVVSIDLSAIDSNAAQVVFILNSYKNQDFKDIPFASVRIYEGTPSRVDEIFATYDIANDEKFAGSVAMVMGKMYRHNGAWKFSAIGDATKDSKLEQIVKTVQQQYL